MSNTVGDQLAGNDPLYALDTSLAPMSSASPSRVTEHDTRKGKHNAVAYGAFPIDADSDLEETPLLQRGSKDQQKKQTGGDREADEELGDTDPPPWEVDFLGLSWYRRPSIFFLCSPLLLFTLAWGGTLVPKLNLILALICREYMCEAATENPNLNFTPIIYVGDNPQCQIPVVQARVSRFMLYISLISGILSAIMAPKLGSLSDRYGRLRVLCLATGGTLVGEVVTLLVATFPEHVSVNFMLFSAFCDGLCGSFTTVMAICHAYASDCTPPSKRSMAFAIFHCCLFTGIGLGPILTGYLAKWTGTLISVFWFALAAHGVFLTALLGFIPESLTKGRQLKARQKHESAAEDPRWMTNDDVGLVWRVVTAGRNFFAPLSILWPTAPGSSPALRRNLFFLAAVDTTMFGVAMGSFTVVLLYSEYTFGWDTLRASQFTSVVNVSRVTVLLIILPLIVRIFRPRPKVVLVEDNNSGTGDADMSGEQQPKKRALDRNTGADTLDINIIRVAILFDILGYVGYATSANGTMFTISGMIAAFGGMVSPTLQSTMTKHVPADRVGQLLGATGLLHALARVVSPLVFNLIYSFSIKRDMGNVVFWCLAATFGVSWAFSWGVRKNVYWKERSDAYSRPTSSYGTADHGHGPGNST